MNAIQHSKGTGVTESPCCSVTSLSHCSNHTDSQLHHNLLTHYCITSQMHTHMHTHTHTHTRTHTHTPHTQTHTHTHTRVRAHTHTHTHHGYTERGHVSKTAQRAWLNHTLLQTKHSRNGEESTRSCTQTLATIVNTLSLYTLI